MRVRIRLDLAYDGAEFAGWARQPALRTVQGCLEGALARLLRLPTVSVTCAGRTDAGVHASGQVAHADIPADGLDVSSLARRLNGMLPADLRVHACIQAAPGFDARFAALWRRYRYRVCDQPAAADPVRRGQVLWWRRPVDVDAMNEAASGLVGEHDFAAFCRPRPGSTALRQLHELDWRRDQGLAVLTARADAFCHHMVRSLVGALLVVGEGRRPVGWPAELLRGVRRDGAVPVVPAHGLTLEEVGYPADAQLGERTEQTRRRRVARS